ncbi:calaxin isoform X1 [Drosophila kikkawai]|uniref:Calaxin isoform X1 n=1 Tax=Drosophila kikkawai TaxID=30033 RepID=A0A6P4IMI6_DROKI|nr:calcium and integrin-binding family member 4 [Drosophila kikkawai]KAH8309083.1 hypothetical protein KR059_005660 [Drosophila kikkawai]
MKDLDQTIDTLENARFNWLYANEIVQMSKDSIFTTNELICIVMLYHKMVLANGPKAKFMIISQLTTLMLDLFEITDCNISTTTVYRISHGSAGTHPDFCPDRHVSLESFVRLLTIYFTRDLEIKMEFAFSIYDKQDKLQLNGEDVGFFLKKFFEGEDEEEATELLLDMKEMIFLKFDLDKDTNISYDEYCDVVRKQPMLMEFLGRVFPTNPCMDVLALCANVMSWFDDSPNPRIIRKSEADNGFVTRRISEV